MANRGARSLKPGAWSLSLALVAVLGATLSIALHAQFEMPDPRQMAGIPRPVTDLPDGHVSVRLIRGQLSNNLPDHRVELRGDGKTLAVNTDESGRAQFSGIAAGTPVRAFADVDGERLESQEFPFPGRGGIRLLLVATAKAGTEAAPPAAVAGQVVIGGESRILLVPAEETVQVYYLLEIVNNARAPVNPPQPFAFDMPDGATGVSLIEGSSPLASAKGSRVTVTGPFPSGRTVVRIGCEVPITGGTLALSPRFPARFETLAVVAKDSGGLTLASPHLANQQTMKAEGGNFIIGGGEGVAAGQPISIELSGLPHHSATPRRIALALALAVIAGGCWFGVAGNRESGSEPRRRLEARREKLMNELVRLEQQRRTGRESGDRYASRREDIIRQLERVYGELDSGGLSGPTGAGKGMAA